MEKLSESQALSLIHEAIKSGSIKLLGSETATGTELAEKRADRDAIYLLTLLKKLQGL